MKYIWFKSNGSHIVMSWRDFYTMVTNHPKRKFLFIICGRKTMLVSKIHYDSGFKYDVGYISNDKHVKIALSEMAKGEMRK